MNGDEFTDDAYTFAHQLLLAYLAEEGRDVALDAWDHIATILPAGGDLEDVLYCWRLVAGYQTLGLADALAKLHGSREIAAKLVETKLARMLPAKKEHDDGRGI